MSSAKHQSKLTLLKAALWTIKFIVNKNYEYELIIFKQHFLITFETVISPPN